MSLTGETVILASRTFNDRELLQVFIGGWFEESLALSLKSGAAIAVGHTVPLRQFVRAAVPPAGTAEPTTAPQEPPVARATDTPVSDGQAPSIVERNNKHLLRLRVGMPQAAGRALMGDPESSDGYAGGSAWLYRTATWTTAQGTATEWTPVVFNEQGTLLGWGRNVPHCPGCRGNVLSLA